MTLFTLILNGQKYWNNTLKWILYSTSLFRNPYNVMSFQLTFRAARRLVIKHCGVIEIVGVLVNFASFAKLKLWYWSYGEFILHIATPIIRDYRMKQYCWWSWGRERCPLSYLVWLVMGRCIAVPGIFGHHCCAMNVAGFSACSSKALRLPSLALCELRVAISIRCILHLSSPFESR